MYPKSRIDALTDGVFAVAMTILVLNLTLPEAGVRDEAALILAVKGLWSRFFPYALSFYVLGSTWLSNIKLRSTTEFVDRSYASWWLLYLLIATCLPFSTSIIERFTYLRPAVWLYSANMAALAAAGYRLVMLLPDLSDDEHTLDRKLSLIFLMSTSLACIALSLVVSSDALWVYLLNALPPRLSRWLSARRIARSVRS
jgi:uncharacterized membrane protein